MMEIQKQLILLELAVLHANNFADLKDAIAAMFAFKAIHNL